jgi:DNA-binding SARP family transcriptional activator
LRAALGASKGETLLGGLALRRERGVARETLEAMLWPDAASSP